MTDRPTLGQLWSDARWGKVPGKPKSLRADTTLDTVEQAKVAEEMTWRSPIDEAIEEIDAQAEQWHETDWKARFVESLRRPWG
jgi:hypothetical protein